MQQIFSQKIRFKNDDGNNYPKWRHRHLNEFMFETKSLNTDGEYDKKNVLSVSRDYGLINQIKHLGRSYAGESVLKYHVVRTGDIVYTKSPLKSNPYGIIKFNKGEGGIVSTLYAVYGCIDGQADGEYLDYYFQLDDNTNRYLRPLVHKGAKNDMKINNARVLIDKIWIPEIEEQRKIVRFLKSLDEKIALIQKELIANQDFKKALLQQMFV